MRNASNGLELRPLDWETQVEVHEPRDAVDELVMLAEFAEAARRGNSLWGALQASPR